MATHSSVLAWRIPWMETPGGLQSMGLHRVGQDWSDLVVVVVHLPVFWNCHKSPKSLPMYFLEKKKNLPKWTCTVQTCIVQGSTGLWFYPVIISSSEKQGNKSCPLNKTKPPRRSRACSQERSPVRLQPPRPAQWATRAHCDGRRQLHPLRATGSECRRAPCPQSTRRNTRHPARQAPNCERDHAAALSSTTSARMSKEAKPTTQKTVLRRHEIREPIRNGHYLLLWLDDIWKNHINWLHVND